MDEQIQLPVTGGDTSQNLPPVESPHHRYLIASILILVAILFGSWIWQNQFEGEPDSEPVFCTQEAKQCPDGSYVGRVGPTCEFAACPSAPNSYINTSTPQTYRDEESGFEFQYPGEWRRIACSQVNGKNCLFVLEFPKTIIFPSESKGQIGTGNIVVSVGDTTSSYSRELERNRIQEVMDANYVTPPETFGVDTQYGRESSRFTVVNFINQNSIPIFHFKYIGKYGDTHSAYYFDTNKTKTVRFAGDSIDVDFPKLNENLSKIIESVRLL